MASARTPDEHLDYIERRLTWFDKDLQRRSVSQSELLARFPGPLVVLGDPGMGKTWLMERFGRQAGCHFIRATSLLRQPDGTAFAADRLIIDGLDEVSSLNESDPLDSVLVKLLACHRPPFVLSCRAAEWRGKSAEIDIGDEYGHAPHVVDLELLTEEEALAALARRVDPAKARSAISALQAAGLESFFQNPLYLDFVAAIVAGEEDVPRSRGALYEQAVAQLCVERNPRHTDRGVATLSREAALDAAGAIAAAMLITGKTVVARAGGLAETIGVPELGELADLAHLRAVLGSNLFRAADGSGGRFKPLHRTVAEYLAARWLARFVDRELDTRNGPRFIVERLTGLIFPGEGVPASLRGVHAWLPKFSPSRLGPSAIERDPYGVLRYGDGDALSPEQARRLIGALRRQARFDPNFRHGWGRSEALAGLAPPALADELRTIVTDTSEPLLFRLVVLEAISGSESAALLRGELKGLLFDPARTYRERWLAGGALARLDDRSFGWPPALERLLALGDSDSTRLAAELLGDIGFTKLEPNLVATVILADCRLAAPPVRGRTFGSLMHAQKDYPPERTAALLDALASELLPQLDPEKWWSDGLHDGWSEFGRLAQSLIARQLRLGADAVTPRQLWRWLRMIERQHRRQDEDRANIAAIIASHDRLRRGVQRIALFEEDDEDRPWSSGMRLARLSSGLILTREDAEHFLHDVVDRRDPADLERWKLLVSQFSEDGRIPVPIRKVARPYARGDADLEAFLLQRPIRRKLEDWERKYNRRDRDYQRREAKRRQKHRKEFGQHIEAIRAGEPGWLIDPAKAYLNRYRDLYELDPEARVAEWLGADLAAAVLEGFEAILHRDDLPSADEVAHNYAQAKRWPVVFPLMAGTAQRFIKERGFTGLPLDLVSAALIASQHELVTHGEKFDGLDDRLREVLRGDEQTYEAHMRRMIEPMLAARQSHVPDLYRFTHQMSDRPLATRLALEWLQRFPELLLEAERYLVEAILHAPQRLRDNSLDSLVCLARTRVASSLEAEQLAYWQGIQFCVDFNTASNHLPPITGENRDWLWALTRHLTDRNGNFENYLPPSLAQLAWLLKTFRSLWPYTPRPSGVTSGDRNPWDATQVLEWVIYQIGKSPSPEAAQILRALRDEAEDGYSATIQANIAAQRQAQVEASFQPPSLERYKAVLSSAGQPQGAADVQAIIVAELHGLQRRLRGDPLNPAGNFYSANGVPKSENHCRDQMLMLLGDHLPFGIQAPPEFAMPAGKRSDGAFTFGNLLVPLECKGQWHSEVWTAAASQLDAFYAVHHKAAEKGIYVVFWFGADVPDGKKPKRPPAGTGTPTSAREMQLALEEALPPGCRGRIAIVVLDLTVPH